MATRMGRRLGPLAGGCVRYRTSLAMAAAGIVLSGVAFLLSSRSVANDELSLLRGRAAETNTVVQSLASQVETSFSTFANLIAQGGTAGFPIVAQQAGGPASPFSGLALLRRRGSGLAIAGQTGSIGQAFGADGTASPDLTAAIARGGYQYVDVVSSGSTRTVGILEPLPGLGAGWWLYAEIGLPTSAEVIQSSSGDLFSNLDFAVYLGARESTDTVVLTNSVRQPLQGATRASVVTHAGRSAPVRTDNGPGTRPTGAAPGDLVVVVTATSPLEGRLSSLMPWGAAGTTLLVALLFAAFHQRSLRRARAHTLVLAESERNLRRLFDEHPHPMWAYDVATLRFLTVNDAAISHYGYSREEFLAMTIADIRPPDEDGSFRRALEVGTVLDRSGPWRHRLKNGREILVEITSHEQDFAGHRARLVMAQDVTERVSLEEQLRHQAFHDALTALPNRALFNDRLVHALGRTRRGGENVAVLLLDIDDFKLINDSMGHAAGDILLMEVAGRLSAGLRPSDTAARLGGDEFAVLMEHGPGSLEEDAAILAQRLIDELGRPYALDGRPIRSTVSIGIALSVDREANELMRDADIALYAAKNAGKARWELYRRDLQRDVHLELHDRLTLQTDLARAVAENELFVVYQPQVDLRTSRIRAVEALARWRHPQRGLIGPDVFIPLAERAGLIRDIDAWVLQTACVDARRWADSGLAPVRVAVNMSGRHLVEDDNRFVETLVASLNATGIAPQNLEVELTESVAVAQQDRALAVLRELRQLHVHVAIDDFGTGYSALARLREFPPDRIKIDRSFISGIDRSPKAAALVASMITMGHSIGLTVLAEGVETIGELELLSVQGCDEVQGYLVSRPVPAAWIEAMLRDPEAVRRAIRGEAGLTAVTDGPGRWSS